MPQRKAGIKALRKTRTQKMRNLDQKTALKKTVKKYLSTVKDNKLDDAKTDLSVVYKKLDKAAKTNIISKNAASRQKSKFGKLLNPAKKA